MAVAASIGGTKGIGIDIDSDARAPGPSRGLVAWLNDICALELIRLGTDTCGSARLENTIPGGGKFFIKSMPGGKCNPVSSLIFRKSNGCMLSRRFKGDAWLFALFWGLAIFGGDPLLTAGTSGLFLLGGVGCLCGDGILSSGCAFASVFTELFFGVADDDAAVEVTTARSRNFLIGESAS
jgi:hypothetical protein